jgi:hypothetical protein
VACLYYAGRNVPWLSISPTWVLLSFQTDRPNAVSAELTRRFFAGNLKPAETDQFLDRALRVELQMPRRGFANSPFPVPARITFANLCPTGIELVMELADQKITAGDTVLLERDRGASIVCTNCRGINVGPIVDGLPSGVQSVTSAFDLQLSWQPANGSTRTPLHVRRFVRSGTIEIVDDDPRMYVLGRLDFQSVRDAIDAISIHADRGAIDSIPITIRSRGPRIRTRVWLRGTGQAAFHETPITLDCPQGFVSNYIRTAEYPEWPREARCADIRLVPDFKGAVLAGDIQIFGGLIEMLNIPVAAQNVPEHALGCPAGPLIRVFDPNDVPDPSVTRITASPIAEFAPSTPTLR